MKITKLFIFLGLLFSAQIAFTQTVSNPNEYEEDKPLLYKHEYNLGFMPHTSGWGFNFKRQWHLTGYKKRVMEYDFAVMKHPKEVRSLNPYFENTKSFIYGKLNYVMMIRGGYGFQKVLFGKADRGAVEVRMVYTGGISLALAKPIYLEILKQDPNGSPFEFFTQTEKYDPDRHQLSDIFGRASFFKGLEETKFHPGLYVKLGLVFEYSPVDDDVKAIEAGIIAEGFPDDIEIMAFNKANPGFINVYLNFMFGKKW
ncbi:MAG TPA: hypothetical protein PKH65_10745 [Bacteroidia bacterium]|nr:hypothetical protein [Bacteroidia bacterium]HNT81147.1 hypothetical protein [Bacteroidia bacterium]